MVSKKVGSVGRGRRSAHGRLGGPAGRGEPVTVRAARARRRVLPATGQQDNGEYLVIEMDKVHDPVSTATVTITVK
jgi:hypothetical protein